MKVSGEAVYIYIYDVGGDINVAGVEKVINKTPALAELRFERTMPEYLALPSPPLFVEVGRRSIEIGGAKAEMRVQARVHAIGAVSIIFRVPFECDFADMRRYASSSPAIRHREKELKLMDMGAAIFRDIFGSIRGCVAQSYKREEVPETYFALCFVEPKQNGAEFMRKNRAFLASLLNEDAGEMSEEEASDTTKHYLTYYANDLVIVDWSGSVVLEPSGKYEDYITTMELANLQLLELRTYDNELDRRIDKAYADLKALERVSPLSMLLGRRIERIALDMARMQAEMLETIDSVRNITKFFGDWTLAKLYAMLANRLYLGEWESSVSRKMATLRSFYEMASDRVAVYRSTLLEALIVLLIVFEIILSVFLYFR
jgi:hypothetical protein